MRDWTLILAAGVFGLAGALGLAGAAAAQPAASELAGTWECRQPGKATKTPPILWIAAQPATDAEPETFDVDGFAGVVQSRGRFASGAGGWSRLEPGGIVHFWVKPAGDDGRPGLLVRLGAEGTPYVCRRLPPKG